MENNQEEIIEIALDRLEQEGVWFTTKEDKLYANAKDLYKLDEYGELEVKSKERLVSEVEQYLGDGAAFIIEAVDQWIQDNLAEGILGYVDTLAMNFEIKEVVEETKAFDEVGVDDLETTVAEEADEPEKEKKEESKKVEAYNYYWKDDIIEVEATEENDDIWYMVAENIQQTDPDYAEYDVYDILSDIISIWKIEKRSRLYDYLIKWFGSEEELLKHVRDVYETNNAIYFVTGCGYAIFDADLLGGNADGNTERAFDQFVNNGGKREESKKVEAIDKEKVLNMKYDDLPDMCYGLLPSDNSVIAIKKGETGYYETDYGIVENPEEFVNKLNAQMGITPEQRMVMELRSMSGNWKLKNEESKKVESKEDKCILCGSTDLDGCYSYKGHSICKQCGKDKPSKDVYDAVDKLEEGVNDIVLAEMTTGKWRVTISKDEKGKEDVNFYDISQDEKKFPGGQFVSSYYLSTLLGNKYGNSIDKMPYLSLWNDIPAWTVEHEDLQKIAKWLKDYAESNKTDLTENKKVTESLNTTEEMAVEYAVDSYRREPRDIEEIVWEAIGIYNDANVEPEYENEEFYGEEANYDNVLKAVKKQLKLDENKKVEEDVDSDDSTLSMDVIKFLKNTTYKNKPVAVLDYEGVEDTFGNEYIVRMRVYIEEADGDYRLVIKGSYTNENGTPFAWSNGGWEDKSSYTREFTINEAEVEQLCQAIIARDENELYGFLETYDNNFRDDFASYLAKGYDKYRDEGKKDKSVNFNEALDVKSNRKALTEGARERLDERNEQSAGVIEQALNGITDQTSEQEAGIINKTSELFQQLSDRGYDVQVSFDNGESTSSIAIGQQGANVLITITDAEQPLRAFISGNFEINDDSMKMIKSIMEVLK